MLEQLAGTRFPWRGRKELAMKHRRVFAVELKRRIIEELLNGMSTLLFEATGLFSKKNHTSFFKSDIRLPKITIVG